MKKIFNYIIAGCLATSFTGCLDMEPISSITDVNYWKDAAQFEAFNVGLHGLLRERSYTIFELGEPRADIYNSNPFTGEATQGVERMIDNTLNAANPVISNFGDFYVLINQLNLMISHTESTNLLDANTKNYYLGEAYGLRAYVYFHLLRSWGDVVLQLDYTNGNSIDIGNPSKAASSAADVMTQIKKDIQSSEDAFGDDFSFKYGKCYWSKAATMMLKGEVYLWSGKHLNGGNTDYGIAKKALESVKSSGVSLLGSFEKIFAYDNKENSEIIFTIHNERNEYDMWNGQYGATMVMSAMFHKSYCDENGIPLTETEMATMGGIIRYQIEQDLYTQLFREGDNRKKYSMKGIYSKENGQVIFKAPVAYKFQGVLLEGEATKSWLDDYPIYRYADCLLLLATAKAFLGEDISAEINEVRERAYGTEYFNTHRNEIEYPNDKDISFYANNRFIGSDENPIEAILKERMREFLFEGKRWYDIRLMGDEYATKYSNASAERLLWPIDENTLGENSALKPTPGY